MKAATPLGVPVMMTVPFLIVVPLLKCSRMAAMSNMRSSKLLDCLLLPFTKHSRRRSAGFEIALVDVITGPIGANLSNDLALPC